MTPRLTPAHESSAYVLVVDDNPLDLFVAREALKQEGLEVVEATDGTQALALFNAQCPSLVVLDVKMPNMNGFECCRQMRASEAGAEVPILMLTGLDDVESINQAYDAGASDFYAKPINPAVMIHRVRYLLRASATAEQLRRSQAVLAHAQQMAGFGYWEWRGSQENPSWSPEIRTILGATPAFSRDGTFFADQVPSGDRRRLDAAVHEALDSHRLVKLEHRVVQPDGSFRVVQHEIEPLFAKGHLTGGALVGVMQDITSRRESEARIRNLAYYDSVTGLPNRALLNEHLEYAIRRAERCNGHVAVLFLDLDLFKRVNDTYGHSVGDELLSKVARRLRRCIREYDFVSYPGEHPPYEQTESEDSNTVARLGGDEFVIVLPDIHGLEDAARVAGRVRDALIRPFLVADQNVCVSTSIGISGYPTDGADVDTLLKHADAAMYEAKADGRDRYQFFTSEINERIARRMDLETALREAIGSDELVLHYQPILSLEDGSVVALEALVRWDRPGHGLVSPAEFIPVAEESRQIVALGEWVLWRACRDIQALGDEGYDSFRVAVNISAVQFEGSGLPELVAKVLIGTGVSGERLELELTETVLMQNAEGTSQLLNELKRLGAHIAIDDFGTGYSSLAYLKRFPIDTLKIDRSFINDVTTDSDDASIVTATIDLARSLRLSVVAEGIERSDQLEFLAAHSCDRGQGFLLARPMPFGQLRQWLTTEQPNLEIVGKRSGALALSVVP